MNRRLMSLFSALLSSTLIWVSNVDAASCVLDPHKFDFMDGSAQVFRSGSEEQIKQVYGVLKDVVKDPSKYGASTIFYATNNYHSITSSLCEKNKCSGLDILKGLQNCSANGREKADACYPLAVVYNDKLYCILQPSLDNYTGKKPVSMLNPFE